MKKLISLVIAFCMIFSICSALSDYYYRYDWTGIVICTNISVRESPSTSAKRYGQLHNGDVVRITNVLDGWYEIDLQTAGLKEASYDVGYVKSSLVKSNPYWIVTTKYTTVYADPWGSGMSNGEMAAGTPMLVIGENGQYYCVQTRHQSAGSSYVRKADIGQYSNNCEPGYAVVVDGPISATSYFDNGYILGHLDSFEIVQVVEWGEYYSHIYYTKRDNTFYDAYVPTMNIQQVIN